MRGYVERVHQTQRVAERVVAGGEPRHRVGEHVLARQAEPVDCAGGDEQRVRGIEPPETPITTRSIPVASNRVSSPRT